MRTVLVMMLAGWSAMSARSDDLQVAAAASLTDVMKALAPVYEKAHPGGRLTFVYGATGQLRTQVLQGAPCDVFIGADRWFGGAESNAAEVVKVESVRIVAANTLVVVAGKGSRPKGDTLASWLDGATRVGIGNPVSVPVGRYTKKMLEGERLWEACAAKCVQGTNVREVLLWLRQGVVDVGFVYGSDLVAVKDPELRALAEYATPGGAPIELAGGVAKATKSPEAAETFLDFLRTPEAVDAFKSFGFATK